MPFEVGQLVAVRADPSRVGPVVQVLPAVDGQARYRVFHGPDLQRVYAEDQLVGASRGTDGEQRPPLGADEFLARLVAAWLKHPLADRVYALRSARIQFVPFQFRPLLRLLRAEQPRLLIADDVGVGKTIEAGLVLKELAARHPLDNVLVVCPKALTVKWQKEMRRFDEDFRILDSGNLRYCLREVNLEGAWPREYRRAIVHYELMRREPYLRDSENRRRSRPGLLDLDPPPRFDLVIADEAHHVRTPGTNGHQLAMFLAQVSTALVLLSATPIQTSSRDLFTLLNLLRPDLFPDQQAMSEVMAPNRHLTAAVRALRVASPDGAGTAQQALAQAVATRWGRATIAIDPRYEQVRQLLSAAPLADADRVRAIGRIEELNTLAPLVNRTRRRDVGPFIIREPHTVEAAFTAAQQSFYERFLEITREQLLARHPSVVVQLIMVNLERSAVSCLPALARRLAAAAPVASAHLTDDPEAEPDETPARPASLEVDARLVELASRLPDEDPKFDRFLHLVRGAVDGTGPGKLLVFSFFLLTLDYLYERLSAEGVRVGLVTGRTDDEERERLRDRFRAPRDNPEALDVLLSSEVGCEGLDYEFCDRLVNYDIPWNPMRVEQRIGRIDRFGQTSDKVLVFNFVTPGTVEERVFHRCWERLGLFREALGDLEGVLGEITRDLNDLARDTTLTPAQLEERARQLADNGVRLVEENRKLDEAREELLGLDESMTRDPLHLEADGLAVTTADLEHLVRTWVSAPPLSGRLSFSGQGIARLQLNASARGHLRSLLDQQPALRDSGAGRQLYPWLDRGESVLPVTFSMEAAANDRSLMFLTPTHPLVRLAVNSLAPPQDEQLTAELQVIHPGLPAGRYLFAIDIWETLAARAHARAVSTVVDLDNVRRATAVENRLLSLLSATQTATGTGAARNVTDAHERLDSLAEQRRRRELDHARQLNEVLVSRQLTSLDSHHERAARRTAERIASATEPRIARMLHAQQEREEQDYQRRRDQLLQKRRNVDIVTHRIAEGVLIVRHEQ